MYLNRLCLNHNFLKNLEQEPMIGHRLLIAHASFIDHLVFNNSEETGINSKWERKELYVSDKLIIDVIMILNVNVDVAGTHKSPFCILFLFIDFLFRILYIVLFTTSAWFHWYHFQILYFFFGAFYQLSSALLAIIRK